MTEWKDEIKDRLANLKLDPTREAEIVEELSQHLEDRYAESLARGATPEEAHLAALAELHDSETLQRDLRQVENQVSQDPVVLGATKRINMLGGVWQDLRYGARMLAKTPGFTLLAVITLALGIGANTAIFSGVNAVLFRPLPGTREPERLCYIHLEGAGVNYADYLDIQARSRLLEGLVASGYGKVGMNAKWRFDGSDHWLGGDLVSGDYFQTLGVATVLGRALIPEDDSAGAENAVVLSDGAWRNRFAADPKIIGKQVNINDHGFTVVGVTAPIFQGTRQPFSPEWWIGIRKAAALKIFGLSLEEAGRGEFHLVGRLKAGASPRQAQAELAVIFAGFKNRSPEVYKNRSVVVELARGFGIPRGDRPKVYPIMAIALAVVGLTLLIACANVTSFILARAANRRKEIAVRLALGASRFRIVRMLLAESALLAASGGMAALALSFWTTDLLSYALSLIINATVNARRLAPVSLLLNLSPDWKVFGATLLISLLVGIVCGLAPALQASKADLTSGLKVEPGATRSRLKRLSWRNALVVAQVAASLALLAGSVLFLRSVQQALRFDPGYESQHLFFNDILSLDKKRYSVAQAEQYFRDLQSRMAAMPEAQSACLAEKLLLSGRAGRGFRLSASLAGAELNPFGDRGIESINVSPQFFATAGIPLVSGREFTWQDGPGPNIPLVSGRDIAWQDGRASKPVVIINEAIARRAFPGQNPVGQQLRLFSNSLPPSGTPLEIVGVVKDAKHHITDGGAEPYIYQPIGQSYSYYGGGIVLYVRTRRDPAEFLPTVASLIRSIDPEVPFRQSTMAETIYQYTLPSKIASAFIGLFGGLGLLLAAVGLSGALAYAVAQRTKEIGIRMALGAGRAAVLRMIIGEGLALTLAGVVIGLSLALALTRALSSYLYGVSAADPLTYLATTLILIIVALFACYFPAQRAAGVDPMTALRQE